MVSECSARQGRCRHCLLGSVDTAETPRQDPAEGAERGVGQAEGRRWESWSLGTDGPRAASTRVVPSLLTDRHGPWKTTSCLPQGKIFKQKSQFTVYFALSLQMGPNGIVYTLFKGVCTGGSGRRGFTPSSGVNKKRN